VFGTRYLIVPTTRCNDLYAWNGHGNGTTSSSADGLNRLASHGGATPGYDSKGNLTYDGSTSYAYSSENLLTSTGASGPLEYDPLMRFYKNYTSYFVHWGDEYLGEYYNGSIVARYVPGADMDEPVGEVGKLGTRAYYHADERGSVIAGSNDAGANARIVLYDEYGKRGSGGSYRFAYTGQVHLLNDVYDYKSRNYYARLGRFGQTDRIGYGGGMNLYAYVGGDPVNFIDPWGLNGCGSPSTEGGPIFICGGSGGGFGGLGGSGGSVGGWLQLRMPIKAVDGGDSSTDICNPLENQVFGDPQTATIMGARATATRNNQNSPSGRYQEFHANVRQVPGGYAFTIIPGPKGGGKVPISLNPNSFGSAHNHEFDSYSAREGYLSDGSTNSSGHIELDNDAKAYDSFFSQASKINPNIRDQLHIALAIGTKSGHIYYWKPGANLNTKGKDVGPTFCAGGE
jgi:RHS repeat-associated protein